MMIISWLRIEKLKMSNVKCQIKISAKSCFKFLFFQETSSYKSLPKFLEKIKKRENIIPF